MKRQAPGVLAACMFVVLVAGAVSAQTTAPQGSPAQATPSAQASSANAEQQIRTAQQQLVDAERKQDKEAARRLMADDLTWVMVGGKLVSREEMLATTPTPPRDVTIDRVQAFGDTAIVTGSAHMANGTEVRYIQEWVNRDGQWRIFAHQGTAVQTAAAAQAGAVPPAAGTAGRSTMRSSAPTLASDDERAIWKTQDDLQRAFLTGDVATYSKLTSDDYVRVTANGEQQDKSAFLQTVKRNADQSAGQLESGDVQIAVSGDTARLLLTTWGTLPGGQQLAPERVTRVFVKRNGQWQQAAAIFTPVAQQ